MLPAAAKIIYRYLMEWRMWSVRDQCCQHPTERGVMRAELNDHSTSFSWPSRRPSKPLQATPFGWDGECGQRHLEGYYMHKDPARFSLPTYLSSIYRYGKLEIKCKIYWYVPTGNQCTKFADIRLTPRSVKCVST